MRRWVLFVLVLATLRARQAYKAHKHAHKHTHTHDACTRTNDKVAQSHSLSPVWNVANTFTWSILKRKLRIIFLWLPINSCTRINPQKIHCPSVCVPKSCIEQHSRHVTLAPLGCCFCRTHLLSLTCSLSFGTSFVTSALRCINASVCVCVLLAARPENFSCALVSRQFFFSGSARFAFCCAGCYSAAAGKLQHIHTHNWKTWLFNSTNYKFQFYCYISSSPRALFTHMYTTTTTTDKRKINEIKSCVSMCVCVYIYQHNFRWCAKLLQQHQQQQKYEKI